MHSPSSPLQIAVFGTGAVGRRLGQLTAERTGHHLFYGSRQPDQHAAGLRQQVGPGVRVGTYAQAAAGAGIIILATPWAEGASVAALAAAGPLDGKIVVDATNVLNSDWSPATLPEGVGSGAEEIARRAAGARVVKAFNTVFADVMTPEKLRFGTHPVTTFCCGDDPDAKARVRALAAELGFAPVDAGPLSNARYLEAMAHLNIQLAVPLGGGTDAAYLYLRRAETLTA